MKGTSSPAKPVPFEAALGELETIVADMENGELPLDQLIGRYEEGMRLVKVCHDKLAEAEQKIEILTRAATAVPVESPAEANPGPALF
jgi:exodeoxyribonuclease VII small subunit